MTAIVTVFMLVMAAGLGRPSAIAVTPAWSPASFSVDHRTPRTPLGVVDPDLPGEHAVPAEPPEALRFRR
jgi:hypothetical protein